MAQPLKHRQSDSVVFKNHLFLLHFFGYVIILEYNKSSAVAEKRRNALWYTDIFA